MSPRIRALAVVLTVSLLCLAGLTNAYLTHLELQRLCTSRTGLTSRDIAERRTRNEDCAVDCITKQGTVMTAFVDDGTGCHNADGYKCVLGKCRSPDDKQYDENLVGLNTVEIQIKSAFVADRDPYPTQGESDAFVVVEMASDDEPAYKAGDLVCHTHVVQDNSRPRWNFACKPLPMNGSAKLRFVVFDSDKPDTDPQLLGTTTQTLDTLLNGGSQQLTLEQPNLTGGPYWLEVDVKGKKYNLK